MTQKLLKICNLAEKLAHFPVFKRSCDVKLKLEEYLRENSLPLKNTAEKTAQQSKVSHQTVKNAEKFTDGVDKIAENTGINP